jgi:hypothetical protein
MWPLREVCVRTEAVKSAERVGSSVFPKDIPVSPTYKKFLSLHGFQTKS